MARDKYQTLTEQMFYILLCLEKECCGIDITKKVSELTNGRVIVGPGTLYNLLENFQHDKIIRETKVEGRRRSYIITTEGQNLLKKEYDRILILKNDYEIFLKDGDWYGQDG